MFLYRLGEVSGGLAASKLGDVATKELSVGRGGGGGEPDTLLGQTNGSLVTRTFSYNWPARPHLEHLVFLECQTLAKESKSAL